MSWSHPSVSCCKLFEPTFSTNNRNNMKRGLEVMGGNVDGSNKRLLPTEREKQKEGHCSPSAKVQTGNGWGEGDDDSLSGETRGLGQSHAGLDFPEKK